MYTVYQVILIAEDGEYTISDWQTEARANQEVEKLNQDVGEGQFHIVQPLRRGY